MRAIIDPGEACNEPPFLVLLAVIRMEAWMENPWCHGSTAPSALLGCAQHHGDGPPDEVGRCSRLITDLGSAGTYSRQPPNNDFSAQITLYCLLFLEIRML